MKKATIKITLEDVISYEIEYNNYTERAYDTIINSLIYDEEGHIIASDDYVERLTSESYTKNYAEKITMEKSDETIINGYINRIYSTFKIIEKYNEDFHSFWESMQPTEDFYMDREDIEYNEELWYQYKPLYNLLQNKGYDLELQVA